MARRAGVAEIFMESFGIYEFWYGIRQPYRLFEYYVTEVLPSYPERKGDYSFVRFSG